MAFSRFGPRPVSGDPKTQENAKGIWGHGRGPLAPKSYCCKVLLLEIEQEIRLVFFLGFGVSEGPGVLPDNIFFQVHTCIKNKTATFYFNFFFTKLFVDCFWCSRVCTPGRWALWRLSQDWDERTC